MGKRVCHNPSKYPSGFYGLFRYCHKELMKDGLSGDIQWHRCSDCGKRFYRNTLHKWPTPYEIRRLVSLRLEGFPLSEITELLGMSRKSVTTWLKRLMACSPKSSGLLEIEPREADIETIKTYNQQIGYIFDSKTEHRLDICDDYLKISTLRKHTSINDQSFCSWHSSIDKPLELNCLQKLKMIRTIQLFLEGVPKKEIQAMLKIRNKEFQLFIDTKFLLINRFSYSGRVLSKSPNIKGGGHFIRTGISFYHPIRNMSFDEVSIQQTKAFNSML